MALFDVFRPGWKHPDAAIRLTAISALEDQSRLEEIASSDPSEPVRLAAVQKLANQEVLLRLAQEETTLAVAAVQRLTEPQALLQVAQTASVALVRELAVERIDDEAALHRIADCDTDAWVRLKARSKTKGRDRAKAFIRNVLAELALAEQKTQANVEFGGTLDEVCAALVRDRRFKITGSLQVQAIELSGADVPRSTCAEMLALKRAASGEVDQTNGPNFFYHIQIWRTASDTYSGYAAETKLSFSDKQWAHVPWSYPGFQGDSKTAPPTAVE